MQEFVQPAPRMFICQSAGDEAFAGSLVERLRGLPGVMESEHVYLAPPFAPGEQPAPEQLALIDTEPNERSLTLLILSPRAVVDPIVRHEVALAIQKMRALPERRLIAVLAEDCDPLALDPQLSGCPLIDFVHQDTETAFAWLVATMYRYPDTATTLPARYLTYTQPTAGIAPPPQVVPPAFSPVSPGGTDAAPTPLPRRLRPRDSRALAVATVLALVIMLIAGLVITPSTRSFLSSLFTTHQQSAATRPPQQSTATTGAAPTATPTLTAVATSTPTPQNTATPGTINPQALYQQVTSKAPLLSSSLNSQDANNWAVITYSDNGGCHFSGGAYHATRPTPDGLALCFEQVRDFTDIAFQARLTIQAGDEGGIIFRAALNNHSYRFGIRQADGHYDLYGTPYEGTILANYSSLVRTGLGQSNLLTAICIGSTIYLYINEQWVATVTDTNSQSGEVGVFAYDNTDPTDVAFNDAEVWAAP